MPALTLSRNKCRRAATFAVSELVSMFGEEQGLLEMAAKLSADYENRYSHRLQS